MAAKSPQVRDPREKARRKSLCFLPSSLAHCHFSSVIFARTESPSTKTQLGSITQKENNHNSWAYFKTTSSTTYLLPSHFLHVEPAFLQPSSIPTFLCSSSNHGRRNIGRKNTNKVFTGKKYLRMKTIKQIMSPDGCNMFTETTPGNLDPRKKIPQPIPSSCLILTFWVKTWPLWPWELSDIYMFLWAMKWLLMCTQLVKTYADAKGKTQLPCISIHLQNITYMCNYVCMQYISNIFNIYDMYAITLI